MSGIPKGYKFAKRRPSKWLNCKDCGIAVYATVGTLFCRGCREERDAWSHKMSRVRAVTRDPNFYRKQNAYKNRWAREMRRKRPPLACRDCGIELPRVRGRQTVVRCRPCAHLYHLAQTRRFRAAWRALHPRPPIPCTHCGVLLPSIRGRNPAKAACRLCRRRPQSVKFAQSSNRAA